MIYYKKKTVLKRVLNGFYECFENFETSRKSCSNFLKKIFIFTFILIAGFYLAYLFLLPDENKAEQILSDYLSKNTKLLLDIDNLRVNPNYKFDINLKADCIRLKYPDKQDFIVLNKPSIDINLLTLPFKYLDLSKIKSRDITVNTVFTKSNKYSIFDYIDFKKFNSKSNLNLINIKVISNELKFNLYDENINQSFVTKIKNLEISEAQTIKTGNKTFKIVGNGTVKSAKFKIADLDLNLLIKIKPESFDKILEKLSKLNNNPFKYAFEYRFYSKIKTDLSFNGLSDRQNIDGSINLSNYTFKYKNIDIPKNDAKLLFKGNKISFESDFNFIKNQFVKIKANADISKNKYIEAKLTSNELNLKDFKEVTGALVKILNIKFNPDDIELVGSADVNIYIKSNFKTISSKGWLKIKDTKLYHKKLNLNVDKISSDINFDNNKINIINTSAFVNNSKFYVVGTVDDKTNLNIKANSDLINISQVITLVQSMPFLSKLLPELDDFNFKSGLIKINAQLKGNFKNPIIETNSVLKDFRVSIKSLKSEFNSPEILISANPEKNTIKEVLFKIKNSNLKVDKYNLKIPVLDLKISDNNVVIPKTPMIFEGINFTADGIVENYNNDSKVIRLNLDGVIPINNNFISIKTNGSNKIGFNSKIFLKNNNLAVNSLNLLSSNKQIANISGEIKNITKPETANFKISVPDRISFIVKVLDNLSFDIKGEANLSGNIANPNINSNLNIYNLSYKPLKLYLSDIIINSKNSVFYINSASSKINDLGFDFVANAYYKNKKIIVDFIQFNSSYIDLSRLQTEFKSFKELPMEIKNLKAQIETLELAGITLNSVKFEGSYKDNIVKADKLTALAYDGAIQGSGTLNLVNNKIISDLVIKDISVRKLLAEINEIKNLSLAVSGHLSALIKSEIILPVDQNANIEDLIKNTNAYIKFNMDNGELAQFAKLERFLQAGNILSQSILKLSLNSIASVITKQNTGYFKTIEGTVKIYNSKADIQYIKTIGTNMSMYIEGKLNLLSRYAELYVLGRIPISIVNVMGKFGNFTTQKLVEQMPDDKEEVVKELTASPIEKMFSTYVSEEKYSKIPPLANPTNSTREFSVNIFGLITDVKSINNFKWILR